MATVLLIRHGRTTANSSGVLAGWTPDVALDDTGRDQALRLGKRLQPLPLIRLVASPLQRCKETAATLAEDRELTVDTDDDLGECRYGAWTGKSLGDLTDDPLWRVVQDHPSGAVFPPDPTYAHESMAAMQARAVAAVRRIDQTVTAEHGEHAVWALVSHGDVIKAILADALGMHLDSFQRITVNPASISVVRYTPRRAFVLRSNDCGGSVDDLVPPPHEAATGDAVPGGSTGADSAAATGD